MTQNQQRHMFGLAIVNLFVLKKVWDTTTQLIMYQQTFVNKMNKELKFKKGDKVVMHSCGEAEFEDYKGVIWRCESDSFIAPGGDECVFLDKFSGSFIAKYLQVVKLPNSLNVFDKLSFEDKKNIYPTIVGFHWMKKEKISLDIKRTKNTNLIA